ncbi:MAG: hypothetical protein IT249_01125 [Chitinophagaceae bacterium]|nr:hypothetical protein [Chitinophagaceae bacterium]
MKKLFDLRFVIGLFFLVVGVLLIVYSLVKISNLNFWCGCGFVVFGVLMIILYFKRP